MKKRLISLLCAIAMIFSILPAAASADFDEQPEALPEEDLFFGASLLGAGAGDYVIDVYSAADFPGYTEAYTLAGLGTFGAYKLESGTYNLQTDLVIDGVLLVGYYDGTGVFQPKDIVINLNGHTLKRSTPNDPSVIVDTLFFADGNANVLPGANLTINGAAEGST